MINALIQGKLSLEHENMEDLLTSNIFGALELCQDSKLLLDFLKQATAIDGAKLFDEQSCITQVTYRFWPNFKKSDDAYFCQPDLLLEIHFEPNNSYIVFIEAKYLSGKSSFEQAGEDAAISQNEIEIEQTRARDQLAKQWRQLIRYVRDERTNSKPILVYLTAHTSLPQEELEESSKSALMDFKCYWLSWRHLYGQLAPQKNIAHKRIEELLLRFGLHFFNGFNWSSIPIQMKLPFPASQELPIKTSKPTGPYWRFKA